MYGDNLRYKSFARRTAIIAGGKMVLLTILAGRMYQLQVVQSDRYKLLADENRINLHLLPPPRGEILDRFGKPLAINRDNYRVLLTAEKAEDVQETLDALGRIIALEAGDRRRIIKSVRRRRRFVPVTVRENLDWREFSRVAVHMPDLPGISIDVGQTREYPFGKNAAHFLGYVAAVSDREMTGDPLLELPGFRVGKSGVEKVYDLPLRGKAGNRRVEVNAVGRVIRELEREDGAAGRDIRLTIDMGLQESVVRLLDHQRSASAVVLDVHTGEVLALASSPNFDPNQFTRGLTEKDWQEMLSDPRAPLTNKAVSGQYSPGSTFKMIVALAGLKARAINSRKQVHCTGRIHFGNSTFHCWKRQGHGPISMIPALQQSCDIYFYEVARRTGIDQIAAMAARFGLGKSLGVDLPNEKSGLIPTKDWKLAVRGTPWRPGETMVAGIGQGFVLATPLQLAIMTARLVNGGRAVTPSLVPRQPGPDGTVPEFPPIGVTRESLRLMLEGMRQVTNTRMGTAYSARITDPRMQMGGKTGTSQVRRISKSEREGGVLKNRERPWHERDHALFVGYAPVHQPRYAVAVVVEHGGGGSKVAAPIARDILRETQRRDPSARGYRGPAASIGRVRT